MAKGCKKCDPHEICEECPEWIFTLADLIMCMMGLFVILWVLKPGGQPTAGSPAANKLNETVGAIREGFGYIPDPDSTDPVDLLLLDKMQRRLKQNGPGEKGKTKKESDGVEGTDNEVTAIRNGPQAVVGGPLLFAQGDANLTREVLQSLDGVVTEIRGHQNIVMIKGHTSLDDLPENATDEQKLDLSLRRAQAISNYLTSKGVAANTLRVQGCSTFEPVKERAYTQARQAANRRVEVEVTRTLVEDLRDKSKEISKTITTPAQLGETASVRE